MALPSLAVAPPLLKWVSCNLLRMEFWNFWIPGQVLRQLGKHLYSNDKKINRQLVTLPLPFLTTKITNQITI